MPVDEIEAPADTAALAKLFKCLAAGFEMVPRTLLR
jgi:hypothetical protein